MLFAELKQDLQAYLNEEQVAQIEQAFLLAEKAHTGQKRHSGEDYITHPVAVARILAAMNMDAESIMAALMHDVIEDTGTDKKTIADQFGTQVAELVDGVSKLTQIKFGNKLEAQAENFRKMLLAMSRDIRVILIKLADRLHNMRTLGVLPYEKRRRIARETLDIYAPIANRLGMRDFFIEFEDLGFRALHPFRYSILKSAVKSARGNRKEILSEIDAALKKQLQQFNIPYIEITGREKHLYSIYRKMRNKRIPFVEIMDVYAFRIIVPDVDTCYRVLGIVHNLYKPILGRFKDYIAIPKTNNYQSLHTTLFGPFGVPIEIQIRTKEMEQVADTGIAAHWLYKSQEHSPDKAQLRARQWLKGLMEMEESTQSPLEFIENVKIDLFPHEVYVFTPQGKILELPNKATAVDFAYAVHSDIGNTCIAAKINRRLAPLSTVLRNGQTVEIITAPGARPNPAWLNFVATSKARSNIRAFVKDQRRTEAIALGKELLDKALMAINFDKANLADDKVLQIAKQRHYKNRNELFAAIGMGNQLPIAVARAIVQEIETIKTSEQSKITDKKQKASPLFIKGSQGMMVNFATCCRPIPGDAVLGLFQSGQGLVIHRAECIEISKTCSRNPDLCIDVQWQNDIEGDFKVDLITEVINERGVLAQLASTISAAQANIDDISVNNTEGRFSTVKITVSVKNRNHLARVMRRIREVKMVIKLSRAMLGKRGTVLNRH